MSDYNKKTIIKLLEIAKKYKYLKKWEEVILECETKIMSKGVSVYGMFYPEKELCGKCEDLTVCTMTSKNNLAV